MEKINKILEHNRQTICCQGCYRLGIAEGIQQEQKRVLMILSKTILNFPKDFDVNIIMNELRKAIEQIQEEKKE